MSTKIPKNTPNDRKSQAPRCLKGVDLNYANKQILTILGRQIMKLMDASYKELLDKDQLANLSMCHKLLTDFKKQEDEEKELSSLTEQMEKLT